MLRQPPKHRDYVCADRELLDWIEQDFATAKADCAEKIRQAVRDYLAAGHRIMDTVMSADIDEAAIERAHKFADEALTDIWNDCVSDLEHGFLNDAREREWRGALNLAAGYEPGRE